MSSNSIQYDHMEMGRAEFLITQEKYLEALSLLWKLKQRRVQYRWANSIPMMGTIQSLCFADVAGDPEDEIIVGTDEGEIYAIDIAPGKDSEYVIWTSRIDSGVKMLQAGTTNLDNYDFILACNKSERVYVLDKDGQVLRDKELDLKEERISCLFINKHNKQGASTISEIIVGSENNKVLIFDPTLNLQRPPIDTPSSINALCALDSYTHDRKMVVAGTVDGHIYAFDIHGGENAPPLWKYKTAGRVRSLRTGDIDKDNVSEVIVGSEDGYVHVLDEHGKLKWRYYTYAPILDIDTHDIDNDGYDEILLGVADGYIYILTNEGELYWRFEAGGQVHIVRAKDMKKDTKKDTREDEDAKVGIVFGTNDQLMLLQVIDMKKLDEKVNVCFDALKKMRTNIKNPRLTINKLIEEGDEYVRAFAFRRLAGQNDLARDDFPLLLKALNDLSPIVKLEMVNIVVTLCRVDQRNDLEDLSRLVQSFLEQLAASSDQELLIALTKRVHVLTNIDIGLCFQYLKRFLDHPNHWVRHEVIHQLVALLGTYPVQVWELLLEATRDEHEWIRQESAHALARYFDLFYDYQLDSGIYDLLRYAVQPSIIHEIADTARAPLVRNTLTLLTLLRFSSFKEAQSSLLSYSKSINSSHEDTEGTATELLPIYAELYRLLHASTLEQFKEYRSAISPEQLKGSSRLMRLAYAFERLGAVSNVLQRESEVQVFFKAMNIIDEISRSIQVSLVSGESETLVAESTILAVLLKQWREKVLSMSHSSEGPARLMPEVLKPTQQKDGQITFPVQIHNEGPGIAYRVRIILEESNEENFTLVHSNEYVLEEIYPIEPAPIVQFNIRLLPDEALSLVRLSFVIIFDDSKEGKNQRRSFVDKVDVQSASYIFRAIPTPYTSNEPISSKNKEMFFGREKEVQELEEELLQTDKVVMLSGLRRAGKTSLLLHLEHILDEKHTYMPIYIQLSFYELKSSQGELFEAIASSIQEKMKEKQKIDVLLPDREEFEQSPLSTMQKFLQQASFALQDRQLLLLIDELVIVRQLIEDNVLEDDFLHSFFLHLNRFARFLLAGGPEKHRVIEEYWLSFMNDSNVIHSVLSSKIEPSEARRLIIEPTQAFLEFDDTAVELIQRLTNNQPYLIHIICEEIIRLCNKQSKEFVNTNYVNRAKENILRGTRLKWTRELLNQTERFLLSALAQEQNDEQPVLYSINIQQRFESLDIPYNEEEMLHAMKNLMKDGIVEEVDSTHVTIPVGLLREWLRKDKPLEKVVRERFSQKLLY